MSGLARGLIAGGLQLALVLAMAGKYAADRATLPRVWVKTVPYDPHLPVRGRYVSLSVYAIAKGALPEQAYGAQAVELSVENGELTATPVSSAANVHAHSSPQGLAIVNEPVAFFIPEGVPDPSRRPKGEELWAEVSAPRRGPPRPLRLGVKSGGVLRPLNDLR